MASGSLAARGDDGATWKPLKHPHRQTLILGLDCATEQYVFDVPTDRLPNLSALRDRGLWGRLKSCIPPITCPAWLCMATSRDPGQLGIYGFRNRADYSYDTLVTAHTGMFEAPLLWETLSAHGLCSVILGVPGIYPPRPFKGWQVCSFLSAGMQGGDYTYPRELRDEIAATVPGYVIDVQDFRSEDKDGLLRRISEMTERRFDLAEHLMRTRPWDLFWLVEMGPDRMHHCFWRFGAPDHRLYEPGHRYENAIADYYSRLDERVGDLLRLAPDDALVLVVSDHGAQTLEGAVCVNDWLMQEGYLTLSHIPSAPSALLPEWVDWSRTRAWAEGGYYARVFLNIRGREPRGIVEPADARALLEELKGKIEAIRDHQGLPMGNRAFWPWSIYREARNMPPDLVVYFGGLRWRSAGTVGHRTTHILENDTGPDDANHSQHGILILADPLREEHGEVAGATIYDVAPTVLERMGLPVPPEMIGRPL